MELTRAQKLIQSYNKVHGKTVQYRNPSSPKVKHVEGFLSKNPHLGDKEIDDAMAVFKFGTKLMTILSSLNNGGGEETPPSVEKKDEKPIVDAMGLLEKALTQVVLEDKLPYIVQRVIEAVETETGPIRKRITFVHEDRSLGEVTHEEFETVATFVEADEPVMLVGPAGTGKNVLCQQVAKLLGLEFYFSNAVTQEYKLTGFVDAGGTYHATEFYKAFKNGGLFMLDEIDASIPDVLVILNAAIANRYFDFPNGRIDAHEDFRVIAAGNTFGQGADAQYIGRSQLDAASLNRFSIVEINYSPTIEEMIAGEDTELLSFFRRFREQVEKNSIGHVVSYRDLGRLSKIFGGNTSIPNYKVMKCCLTKGVAKDDLISIHNKLPRVNRYTKILQEVIDEA